MFENRHAWTWLYPSVHCRPQITDDVTQAVLRKTPICVCFPVLCYYNEILSNKLQRDALSSQYWMHMVWLTYSKRESLDYAVLKRWSRICMTLYDLTSITDGRNASKTPELLVTKNYSAGFFLFCFLMMYKNVFLCFRIRGADWARQRTGWVKQCPKGWSRWSSHVYYASKVPPEF